MADEESDDPDLLFAMLADACEHIDTVDADAAAHRRPEPIRVPRIPYASVSSEEFERRFSATNTPIILGDAFGPDGPVPQQFDLAFFQQQYSDALVP
jgi:hypothetical protein